MNILVIDDYRVHANPDAIHARTTRQGWKLLIDGEWDEVWLDNDMGEYDEEVSDAIVGRLERLWHEDKVRLPVGKFFIHTGNGPAGRVMERAFAKMPYDYERTFPFAKYFKKG